MAKKIDLQAIVLEHYAALYRFGFALAKNESDAADLAQETFLILAKEISVTLGVPIGTVMSRLSRGKEQLRRALGNDLRDDFDDSRIETGVGVRDLTH